MSSTKLSEDPATEAAKKAVEEDKKMAARSRAEYAERSKGKPTPTQEENDLAMHGAHILEHEDDGSGPDPYQTRQMEPAHASGKPANYTTRSTGSSKAHSE